MIFGLSPPEFIQVGFHLLGRFSVPISIPFLSPFLFLLYLLFLKTLIIEPPLSSRPANNLLPTWGCNLTPFFSNSRTSFFFCFLHLWYQTYRCLTFCSTTPHYQHLVVSINLILAKYIHTSSCTTLSGKYHEAHFWKALPSIIQMLFFVWKIK